MDLITNIVVSALTIIASLLTNVVSHDICKSADKICTKIINLASRHLAPADQESTKLEWLGDLSERETVFEKYRHAIGCYFAAGQMKRHAMTITVAMNLGVTGIGTIPLAFKLSPSIFASLFFATAKARLPRFIRLSTITIFVLYVFAKLLLSVHRINPGNIRRFLDEMKQFKSWNYEARIGRKDIDIDVSGLFRAIVNNPSRMGEIVKTYADAFTKSLKEQTSRPSEASPDCRPD